MKLALLLCAKPTNNFVGHSVYVPAGSWKVTTENQIDTEFHLIVKTPTPAGFPALTRSAKCDELITGIHEVNIVITKAGSERNINIFLEKVS